MDHQKHTGARAPLLFMLVAAMCATAPCFAATQSNTASTENTHVPAAASQTAPHTRWGAYAEIPAVPVVSVLTPPVTTPSLTADNAAVAQAPAVTTPAPVVTSPAISTPAKTSSPVASVRIADPADSLPARPPSTVATVTPTMPIQHRKEQPPTHSSSLASTKSYLTHALDRLLHRKPSVATHQATHPIESFVLPVSAMNTAPSAKINDDLPQRNKSSLPSSLLLLAANDAQQTAPSDLIPTVVPAKAHVPRIDAPKNNNNAALKVAAKEKLVTPKEKSSVVKVNASTATDLIPTASQSRLVNEETLLLQQALAQEKYTSVTKKNALRPTYRYNLAQIIQKTISTNPEMLAERANWMKSEYLARQAEGGYLPSVNMQYMAGRELSSNPSTRARGENQVILTRRTSSFSLTQLLFDGGNVRSQVKAAQDNALAAKYRLVNTQQTVLLGMIESYINTLRFSELEQLAEENIAIHESALQKVKAQFRAGAGRASDVDLATARVALAYATLENTRDSLNRARYAFMRLTDMEAEGLEPIKIPEKQLPKSLEYSEQLGLSRNPTIKEAQAQVQATYQSMLRAKATFYPRFDFNLRAAHNMNFNGIYGSYDSHQATVDMNYNLFRGGSDYAATKAATQEHINAQSNLVKVQRSVLANVRNAWSAYTILKKRVPFLAIHLKSMQNTAASYQEQFKLGQRTLLDQLNAQIEAFNAQNNATDAKYQTLLNAYALLYQTGQLV